MYSWVNDQSFLDLFLIVILIKTVTTFSRLLERRADPAEKFGRRPDHVRGRGKPLVDLQWKPGQKRVSDRQRNPDQVDNIKVDNLGPRQSYGDPHHANHGHFSKPSSQLTRGANFDPSTASHKIPCGTRFLVQPRIGFLAHNCLGPSRYSLYEIH